MRGKRNIRAQAVGRFMENDEFALAVGENGREEHLRAGAATGSAWMANNTLSLSNFRWGDSFSYVFYFVFLGKSKIKLNKVVLCILFYFFIKKNYKISTIIQIKEVKIKSLKNRKE